MPPIHLNEIIIDLARQVIDTLECPLLQPDTVFENYDFSVNCTNLENGMILNIIACTCKLKVNIITDKPYNLLDIMNTALDNTAILANANNESVHPMLNQFNDNYPLSLLDIAGTIRPIVHLINDMSSILWSKDDCHHNFKAGHTTPSM